QDGTWRGACVVQRCMLTARTCIHTDQALYGAGRRSAVGAVSRGSIVIRWNGRGGTRTRDPGIMSAGSAADRCRHNTGNARRYAPSADAAGSAGAPYPTAPDGGVLTNPLTTAASVNGARERGRRPVQPDVRRRRISRRE